MKPAKTWEGFEAYKEAAEYITLNHNVDDFLLQFFNNPDIPVEVKDLIAWNFPGLHLTTKWGYSNFKSNALRTFIARAILTDETIPYLALNSSLTWEDMKDFLSLDNLFQAGDMKDALILALCESDIDHSLVIKQTFDLIEETRVSLRSFVPWAREYFNLGDAIPDSWVLRFLEGKPTPN